MIILLFLTNSIFLKEPILVGPPAFDKAPYTLYKDGISNVPDLFAPTTVIWIVLISLRVRFNLDDPVFNVG